MLSKAVNLPLPGPVAVDHSCRLIDSIKKAIHDRGGAISFQRYMQMALYEPGLGYYSAGARKFGVEGDFITAPEISPLFSACLAKQCQQILRYLGSGQILEFGAGSGIMAVELLLELEKLNSLPEQYLILEVSADLRERQIKLVAEKLPHLKEKIVWLEKLPVELHGVVIANEVLDAMPVHKFRQDKSEIKEFYVKWEDEKFAWQLNNIDDQRLIQAIANLVINVDSPNYDSEINLNILPWMSSINDFLTRGAVFIIDYGFPRHEYYHCDRHMGTLMCHYRHQAHGDPLLFPGLQDITAHVDFTAIAEAAVAVGMQVAGFTTQAAFLLGCGLLDLANIAGESAIKKQLLLSQQIQRLIAPHEMGELFKVIALKRNLDLELLGFSLQDQRQRL